MGETLELEETKSRQDNQISNRSRTTVTKLPNGLSSLDSRVPYASFLEMY